mgnify:CR=1 FL=1
MSYQATLRYGVMDLSTLPYAEEGEAIDHAVRLASEKPGTHYAVVGVCCIRVAHINAIEEPVVAHPLAKVIGEEIAFAYNHGNDYDPFEDDFSKSGIQNYRGIVTALLPTGFRAQVTSSATNIAFDFGLVVGQIQLLSGEVL